MPLDVFPIRRSVVARFSSALAVLLIAAPVLDTPVFDAVFISASARAAERGLTLFVVDEPPLTSAPGPASYAPGSRAVARLMFGNRGAAPLEKVRVEADLTGATLAAGTRSWKRDGNTVRATIDTLAPGETFELPLVVELADDTERGARGTGGEAHIRATVPATGETLVAEASWPIASCADAYHAALRRVRDNQFAALRAAVDASRESDKRLPGRMVLAFGPDGGKDVPAAVGLSEQIAKARGRDGYYASRDVVWIADRLVNDIGVYLGQDRYAGLCTGVDQWTAILQEYLGRFTRRAEEIDRHRTGLAPAVRALVAAAGDGAMDQRSGDIEAWDTAAVLLMSIGGAVTPGSGATIFASAREALASPDAGTTAERAAALGRAFAGLERLWYLDLAAQKATAVAAGFTGTLEAIRKAHEETCTCGS